MLVVDAQVHAWAANSPERPWPTDVRAAPQRPVPLGTDELLAEMDAAGVDRVIIVPPSWEGERNDLAIAAAQAHPDRFAIMGRLDPLNSVSRGALAGWCRQPGMLGLRFAYRLDWEVLADGRLDWVWADAEKHGVPIYILVAHAHVPLVDAIAERHPGLKLVMDHMALTEGKDAEAFRDFDKVLAIAKRPNVAAKISALPCFSTDRYPYRNSLQPYIRKAFDAFGPKRLFWGTDLSRSPIPYRQHVTLFTEELPWLKGGDLEGVMGRGVCEWLGWKL